MKKGFKNHLVMLAFGLGSTSLCFAAQPTTVTAMVDSPCIEVSNAKAEEIQERILSPDQRLSPDWLKAQFAKPETLELMKEMQEQQKRDWPNLCKYKEQNKILSPKKTPTAVFMGDSITENWTAANPDFFTHGIIGRGISGQTSPQMLVRFYADVIALQPKVVHIMAGTNDLAGNTGPTTLQDYKNNILAMIDLAQAHDIKVILAAIPPSSIFWMLNIDPRPQIHTINTWLKSVAKSRHLTFVDYASVLGDGHGGMKDSLSNDEVHPTRAGYNLMQPVVEDAIARALAK